MKNGIRYDPLEDGISRVEYIDHMGSDSAVVQAARVSYQGDLPKDVKDLDWSKLREPEFDSVKDAKLIRFLSDNEHLCYDGETEVLTDEGWKYWKDVSGNEGFFSLNLESGISGFSKASRVIKDRFKGEMVSIKTSCVDALITPNHRMVCAPRINGGFGKYGLIPAKDFFDRSHRLMMGGGVYEGGEIDAPEDAALAGFVAADAHVGTSINFNLRKKRKIEWLRNRAEVSESGDGTYRILNASKNLRDWSKGTYCKDRSRRLPEELVRNGNLRTLKALIDGFLEGDGSVSSSGKITCSTVSRQMVDDLQEVAAKLGMAATEILPFEGMTNFGRCTLYRLTFFRQRNMKPKIGWTRSDRSKQVRNVAFDGTVYCVTVPNGTVYVRRNGKTMWSGNSPFEHTALKFHVAAPIFVVRQWQRHRSFSYNEVSRRYTSENIEFHVPKVWRRQNTSGNKQGSYEDESLAEYHLEARSRALVDSAVTLYDLMIESGVAREQARMILPQNLYTRMYVTGNLRSWAHFYGLRADEHAQLEIRVFAEAVGKIIERIFPVAWDALKSGSGA